MIFQHDQNYNHTNPKYYTHSLSSPEDFFIRKFNNDLNLTSKALRLEEKSVLARLFSEPDLRPDSSYIIRIRDFLSLCRGEKLVRVKITYV